MKLSIDDNIPKYAKYFILTIKTYQRYSMAQTHLA